VKETTTAELLAGGTLKRCLLVDVRSPEERAVSTLPGAVDRREAEKALRNGTIAADVPVVCFCTIGLRSGVAAAALQRRFKERDVKNLARGVLGWTWESGDQPFVLPDGSETLQVHTYSSAWALHNAGAYEAVTATPPRSLLETIGGLISLVY
jgi:rhodanese-related sulfurtransferase